jgi:hypothetical protein
MGQFHRNSGEIQNYTVTVAKESGGEVLKLSICTETRIFEYLICSDDRHPCINKIRNFIEKGLCDAKSNEQNSFSINEWPSRNYLHVSYFNGEVNHQQFTGSRQNDLI